MSGRRREKNLRALACNLRGYSSRAAPSPPSAYDYDLLAEDTWNLADAAGLAKQKFHLVGHDHGAVLGWVVSASARAKKQLLSYTSLAIAHVDVLGSLLYGKHAVEKQQFGVNYFNQFMKKDAPKKLKPFIKASANGLAGHGGASAYQASNGVKWYYGAITMRGYVAVPPVLSPMQFATGCYHNAMACGMLTFVSSLLPIPYSLTNIGGEESSSSHEESSHQESTHEEVRAPALSQDDSSVHSLFSKYVFGDDSRNGHAQRKRIGTISVPSHLVCGAQDAFTLCWLPEVKKRTIGSGLVPQYSYLNVQGCGHAVFHMHPMGECTDESQAKQAIDSITAFLDAHSP